TSIQVAHPPLSLFDRALKRVFDITVAAFGLLLLAPLLAILAIAIKLDSAGPILFRQKRHGYNNEAIQVLKLRTMTTTEPGDAFTQAAKNDPRIKTVGRIWRRSNIDDCPQLITVPGGYMSFVAPRPHAPPQKKFLEALIPPLSRRHNVKPGL